MLQSGDPLLTVQAVTKIVPALFVPSKVVVHLHTGTGATEESVVMYIAFGHG